MNPRPALLIFILHHLEGLGRFSRRKQPCPTTLFPLLGMYRQDAPKTLSRKTCLYVCVCVCEGNIGEVGRKANHWRKEQKKMLFAVNFPHSRTLSQKTRLKKKWKTQNHFLRIWDRGCSAQKELFRATFRLQNFYRAFLFPLYFIPLQKRERKAKRSDFHCGSKKMPSFSLCMAREEQKMEVGIRNYAF